VSDADPVLVLVAYPPNPQPDLLARLTVCSPRVEVVASHYEESHARRTARGAADAAALARHPAPDLTAALKDTFGRAEIMLAFDVPLGLGELAPGLRWVQAIGAGTEQFRGARLSRDVTVTNAAGVASVPIAEFVMGRLLAMWKYFDDLSDQQRRHEWTPKWGRVVAGTTLAVVGYGAIGRAIAERARAFDMRVLAVRRRAGEPSPGADEVAGPDQLLDVLGRSDAVVVCAPATSETRDLFDTNAFAAMRPGSLFVNVARGALVDEDALVAALASGHLRGAALDVTREEPLPPTSPLWDVPNLWLSPHSSASPERYFETLFDLFADNLRRYLAGEPLRNVIDPNDLG
jgi:phosphoglycerate dehydrogenase-like enzyme